MKLSSIGLIVSEKICFNMLKGIQYEGPLQKGQP